MRFSASLPVMAHSMCGSSVPWHAVRRDRKVMWTFSSTWSLTIVRSFPEGLVADLEDLLGRRVDVVEPEGLHWYLRGKVLKDAVPL